MEPDRADDLAARLLEEFPNIARTWSQNVEAIERVTGRGSAVPPLLIAARAAMEEAMRSKISRAAIRPEQTGLLDYLKASMGSLADEHLRILFLNGSRHLLADETVQRGTVGQLALYPRVIIRRAIELDASAMILVHNHPSGDPTPSPNDEAVTSRLAALGHALGIEVDEHIVVTATEHRFILAPRNPHSGRGEQRLELRSDTLSGGDEGKEREQSSSSDLSDASRNDMALANARRTARRRLLRRQLLGADHLFGEPAWDMLIELFIHQAEDRPISTSSLGIASGLSATSGLRIVQNLEDAGLVVRGGDPDDGRRSLISLSPDTLHRLTVFFEAHDE